MSGPQSFLLGALAMLFIFWMARPRKKPPANTPPTKAEAIAEEFRTKYASPSVPLLTRMAETPVEVRVAQIHMSDATREIYHGLHAWRAEQMRVSVMSARHFLNLAEAALDNPPPEAASTPPSTTA